MTKEELQHLYKERILPENKNPYHFNVMEEAEDIVEAYNPMCGDKFKIYLHSSGNRLNDIHFHGIGCAISKASTSILLKRIEGMTANEAASYSENFIRKINEQNEFDEEMDEDLKILASLKHFDGRMDCVKLSWEALANYLNDKKL